MKAGVLYCLLGQEVSWCFYSRLVALVFVEHFGVLSRISFVRSFCPRSFVRLETHFNHEQIAENGGFSALENVINTLYRTAKSYRTR